MHQRFAQLIKTLDPSYRLLLRMEPCKPTTLPRAMPQAGVYLFSEGRKHLYVGRSNRIRKRIGNHCREGATYRMAAFAFRLARKATGRIEAAYRQEGSRADLMRDPTFARAFANAKARIRHMDVRFVREPSPVRQALLELYVALALRTPYNEFDTH